SQRQSNEFVRSAKLTYQRLDAKLPLVGDSITKIELENGARILSLPGGEEGKTLRGLAGARLIVIDQASRVDDSWLQAVRPMMATNPDAVLLALTTPHGRRGWFFEAWHDESPDTPWTKIRVAAADCPRITQAFLDEEKKALGPTMFESEYGLLFHDAETQ